MDVEQLLREALRLPVDARAKLAGEIISSLDDSTPDPDRDVAWAAEIRRRLDAYDAGQLKTVPADQVVADIKAIAGGRSS